MKLAGSSGTEVNFMLPSSPSLNVSGRHGGSHEESKKQHDFPGK
jgi:hypothetical protein